jgi:hypothetical protein
MDWCEFAKLLRRVALLETGRCRLLSEAVEPKKVSKPNAEGDDKDQAVSYRF